MTFLGFSGLVNFITCISIALFVIIKNLKNPLNISFFNLNLSVGLYSFGYFFWQLSKNQTVALFWFKILTVGIILINITYLYFVFRFLGLISTKRTLLRICSFINFIFIALNLTSHLYTNLEPRYNLGFWPVPTLLFNLYLVFWFWQCLYGFHWLLKGLKTAEGIKKQRIRYFTISAMFGFVGGATNWPMWYKIYLPPYLNISISLYIAIVAYSIFRYRLLDINVALTRAGIFIFVYALILGVPFFMGYKYGLWMYATWITVFLASAGPFIYQFLRRRAEDAILKEQRRYQHTLRRLSKTMTRIRDLDELLKTITSTVMDTVKVNYCAIYIKDEQYNSYRLKGYHTHDLSTKLEEFIPLENKLINLIYNERIPLMGEETKIEHNIFLEFGLITPYFMEDQLLGFMVLGSKQNNQMYAPEDVLVFETLSYSTSLAIENCIFWKEIEDRQRKARLQEMDTYSYSLAHEIYNPMYVISGEVGFLKKYLLKHITDPEDYKEAEAACKFALEASQRVSGMVEAIREFGAPVTDKDSPLKTEDIVETFYQVYYPKFKDKGIIFEKNIPQGLGYVRGQKPQLMQVLAILSDNAMHAMREAKEKKITLKAEPVNQDRIRIIFTDTGHGIKKEMLEIIFAPFTTTKASTEGTGMGLYNAKNMVERHKGRVWAESEGPGKGATFVIELPIAKDLKPEDLEIKDSKTLFIKSPEDRHP